MASRPIPVLRYLSVRSVFVIANYLAFEAVAGRNGADLSIGVAPVATGFQADLGPVSNPSTILAMDSPRSPCFTVA